MVCDLKILEGQTPEERKEEVAAAKSELKALLATGDVKVAIDRVSGSLTFVNWQGRKGVSDACAYRTLAFTPEMRRAIAEAEAKAGRKLSTAAMNGGIHSHDGGKTWHPGH